MAVNHILIRAKLLLMQRVRILAFSVTPLIMLIVMLIIVVVSLIVIVITGLALLITVPLVGKKINIILMVGLKLVRKVKMVVVKLLD